MKGFINLLKPTDMMSAYAVGAVKHKFNIPCGHMGTLDPMASGVLPVGVGKTSRLFPFLLNKTKTYVANFKFGFSTDTLDITGKVEQTTDILPTIGQVEKACKQFVGEIDQIPPKFSAKCVDGKRGYQLSRRGIDFELPPKKVTVYGIKVLEQVDKDEFCLEIECGGGTYIRSLARDIGLATGSLANMSKLTRTRSGIFDFSNGVSVEEFKASAEPEKYLIAPDKAIDFEKAVLDGKTAQKILDGVYPKLDYKDGLYRVYNEEEFWGVGKAKDGILKVIAYVR